MKTFRIVTWSLCVLLLVFLAYASTLEEEKPVAGVADIGGKFTMMSAEGKTVTEKSFPGKAKMYFLGFTHCPDICPTTLNDISNWLKQLGTDANQVQPIFITADPERDTITILKEYVDHFDSRIAALRPTKQELDQFAKNFKVYYKKGPVDNGSYSVDHTASVLLFRKDNSFFGTIDFHEERDIAVAKLQRLVAE